MLKNCVVYRRIFSTRLIFLLSSFPAVLMDLTQRKTPWRRSSMETQHTSPSTRQGTPGLDIFKIAGQSISGFLPSFKTGSASQIRQPFTSQLEERLAMYLEYHPHVRSYQRGDVSEEFARARHLQTPLGTPYRISYIYDGTLHDYLPDFVGTLCDD